MIESEEWTSRPARGITVIELLIILAALGVVLLISLPASSMMIERYRLNAAATDLVKGLNLARSEAIRRASTVRVCPSSNGLNCRRDGDWNHGWLVFSDGDGDGQAQDIERLNTYEAPGKSVRVFAHGAVTEQASFTLAGLVSGAGGDESGEFVVCYEGSDSDPKTIVIDPDGWVRLAAGTAEGCGAG